MAYVSPSITLSLPWVAKELGILAKHDLVPEILLITGSPRLVQTLISGDVDVVFAGVTALTRARMRGADVAILGAAANVSSQKLLVGRNSKIRRLEEVKGATIGVSQFGSEADTFTRNALATVATRSRLLNCTGERLTATRISPDQDAAAAQARRNTHSPIGTISPVSSATGMNSFGGMMPVSGWRQRSSASKPLTVRSCRSMNG